MQAGLPLYYSSHPKFGIPPPHHILLSLDNYTLDSAKTRIREIKQEIQEGKDFGELASDLSDDTGSKIKGGDLGWFQEGLMVPEFSEACFSSEVGDLKIVRTDVGMHLIEITAVSDLVKKYKIVYLDQNVIATQTTEQDYYGQAHDFINAFKESDNISFKSFSEDQNQLVREIGFSLYVVATLSLLGSGVLLPTDSPFASGHLLWTQPGGSERRTKPG